MTGANAKIKRIMIGDKQVRPSGIHISSDLRGATLAGLQAQGWGNIAYRFSSYVLNSSGLTTSGTHGDVAFLYVNCPNLSASNTIECKVTGTMSTASGNNTSSIGYMSSNTLVFPSAYNSELRCHFVNQTSSALKNGIVYNDSAVLGTAPANSGSGGSFSLTTTINLSTGYVTYNLTSPITHTTSATLSSSQLGNVLTYKNIGVMAQGIGTGRATIYTVDLTIQ